MVNLKKEEKFVDITEPFTFKYPHEQEIGGVIYTHVYGGVYRPEKPVKLSEKEFCDLTATYPDLVFIVEEMQKNTVIYFVNSRKMAQYDNFFVNMFRRRPEFAEFREYIDCHRLEEVCWYDRHEAGAEENCITGLCRFQKPDENNRYQGYRKHIQIGNKIGYLIEPGIYYFENPENRMWQECLKMDLNQRSKEEIAVIGHSTSFRLSSEIAVTYLAIGKENFARLKEIQHTKEDSFFHEFRVANEREEFKICDLDELVESLKNKEPEEEPKLPQLEPEAMELLEGMGFENIRLGYHTVFSKQIPIRGYKRAYILNEKLILIEMMYEQGKKRPERNEIDLRLIGELTVRIDVALNCGINMERDIKVIDCKEEKERELLEAGELRFRDLRKYVSVIDRLSICMLETMDYRNYVCLEDVPEEYDDLYVYGIGMIESEFFKDGEYGYRTEGDRENLTFVTCMEIMLSKKSKEEGRK